MSSRPYDQNEVNKRQLQHGVPADAVPASGINATAITSSTPVTILAAPGAGKCYYITSITYAQPTAAETALLTVQDEDDVAIHKASLGASDRAVYYFDPPLKTTTNKIIEGEATSGNGDSFITINGYSGTA